jgi:catechol 2,3-dioxygenase-like lactoylglutathione lyase family enzyme
MFDHVGFPVSDLARSKEFYTAALAPLNSRALIAMPGPSGEGEAVVAFGDAAPQFWISAGKPLEGSLHVAFQAKDRASVDAFYRAAMAAGGRDNGAPGLRPQYHPGYYGAFVIDPDGHNVEAVHHSRD